MEFKENEYKHISIDELVVYAIHRLNNEKKEPTFENIVAKCFDLFPKKFHLIGYPHWPDSARVNKSWLRCRTDFHYISGSVKTGFQLTSKGLSIVENVMRKIRSTAHQKAHLKKRIIEERSREETFINELEKSTAFKKYKRSRSEFNLSEFELCDMLFCTLESPLELRKKNIALLKEYAEKLDRQEALEFLRKCESKFAKYLSAYKIDKIKEDFSGGMFRKSKKGSRKK